MHGNAQDCGIDGTSDEAPHLYVADAVVDSYKRLSPQLRHCPCDNSQHVERRTHPRTLCVAHAVDLCRRDVCLCAIKASVAKHCQLCSFMCHLNAVARRLRGWVDTACVMACVSERKEKSPAQGEGVWPSKEVVKVD